MTDYGEGIVQVPYDGVNGISLMNNDTGTDGSFTDGTTGGLLNYRYELYESDESRSGISGIEWAGFCSDDHNEIVRIWKEGRLDSQIQSYLTQLFTQFSQEDLVRFITKYYNCQVK